MAKNYFNRYVWLIDTIQQHGYLTFSDISDLWQRSAINDDGSPLPERTFFNHRDAILDIFGIEIKFDKVLGYHIPDDNPDAEGIRNWLLTSLSVNNLVNECSNMKSRILLENIPSGQRFLSVAIQAMKEEKKLEILYKRFRDSNEQCIELCPYCVKLFKQRWYLLALPTGQKHPKIYSLDRILRMQVTRQDFKMPDGFDASDYFYECFGIVHDDNQPAEKIKLKVWDKQRDYFRTLPLHHSQIETSAEDNYSIFEYKMAPTWDLEMELLQYNDNVEVLEPESLRDMMIEHAWNMLNLYGEA